MSNKVYKRGLRSELPLYDDSMSNIAILRTGDVVSAEIMEELNKIGCTSFILTKEQIDDILERLQKESQDD